MTRDTSTDPVVKLAAAIEKCLTDLAAAVGEFREGYSGFDITQESLPETPAAKANAVQWLTNDEAASRMGIASQTLRQWNSRGKCGQTANGIIKKPPKSYKRGGKIGYKLLDIDQWLEANSSP